MQSNFRCLTNSIRLFSLIGVLALISTPILADSSIEPITPPQNEFKALLFEPMPTAFTFAPWNKFPIGINGKPHQWQMTTAYGNTRPELVNNTRLLQTAQPIQCEVNNTNLVNEGCFPMPFGTKGEKPGIAFSSGAFYPPADEKIQPSLIALASELSASRIANMPEPAVYAFIVLNTRLDSALQSWFEANNIELLGFYPETAYQVRIPTSKLRDLENVPEILWVGQPSATQKLNRGLTEFVNQSSNDIRELYVTLFGEDISGSEQSQITNYGGDIGMYDPSLSVLYVKANADTVRSILNMNSVLYVEPVPVSVIQHTQSQTAINADRYWGVYDGAPIDGRSIKVGVIDSGLNIDHSDFSNLRNGMAGYNRTTEDNWWDDGHGHGTHVTGTFMGEGNAQFRYRGVASGIRDTDVSGFDLLFSKAFRASGLSEGNSIYEGLLDMQGRSEIYKRQVFNISGGGMTGDSAGTDTNSRKVDEMFQQNILGVCAVGNNGPDATTIISPSLAKGALSVGSIEDNGETTVDNMVNSSSRGPTGDNRVKPDVVAPGRLIDSCSNTNNTGYLYGWSGTSMASPHVAGLAAGLIQRINLPAWATKAIILATAIDLGYGTANHGRGKVDAYLAQSGGDGGWLTTYASNGATGEITTHDFTVTEVQSKCRIVLVYPDPPAAAGASYSLKNDLDLYLDKEPFTTGATGEWSSTSSRDNVEVINVTNLQPGNYRIKIYTYALNEGTSQSWAFTRKLNTGSTTPNINISLTAPVAVKPNVDFTVTGTASPTSYVASGVFGSLDRLSTGTTLNGMTFKRRGPGGTTESIYFPGEDSAHQGSIGSGYSRSLDWSLKATTTGDKQIRYNVSSTNGGSGSVTKTIMVDGTNPGSWQSFTPTLWVTTQTPSCTIKVQDTYSGLDTSELYYFYWNGSLHGPIACTTTATNGTTALSTITAASVPFNRDDAVGNRIMFTAYDRAGNSSSTDWYTVKTDSVDPGSWTNFKPATSTTIPTPTCSVKVRDITSGLSKTIGAYYRYSTDTGTSWSSWIQTDMTGVDGTTGSETITATNVPFNNISSTENQIEFAVRDVAGNWGYSPTYTVAILKSIQVTARVRLGSYIGSVNPISTVPVIVNLNGVETTKYLTGTGNTGTFTINVLNGLTNVMRVHPAGYLAQKKTFLGTLSLTVNYYGPDGTSGLTGGDTNWDNIIDDFDLNNVNGEFGGPSSGISGFTDINGDGIVDDFELNFINGSFGTSGDPL